MKIKILFSCLIITASFSFVFAQAGASTNKVGTTAAQFLKFGVGPRAIGMGGAFTATSDDITALYWNPGGLSRMNSREVIFNHIDWLLDIKYDFAAFAVDVPGFGSIGAFVNVMSMGDEIVRTVDQPEGTGERFDAGALAIGLSYAKNLTDNFSIGFNAKYIREHYWHEAATGFAVDVGTLYKLPWLNETRIGASICNFGTKMRLEGRDILELLTVGTGGENLINTNLELDSYDLPLLFRIGVAVDAIKESTSRLTVAADAIHPNDNTEYVNSGLEYAWNENIFIRVGYKSLFEKDGEQGLTFGAGVNYRVVDALGVKIDYAYQDFGRLKNVQYFSLGIRF